MIFGAHVSVSKGFSSALDYAESVGCECIQIFAKSPRQWRAAPVDPDRGAAFIEERRTRGFGPVFTHTAYLINLSTADDELRSKSTHALADELVRAGSLGAAGVVTHIGNDRAADPDVASARAGKAIIDAFDLAGAQAKGTRLLLENTAGAGSTFGGSVEQIGACIEAAGLDVEHLGLCFDTCHGFAFGYALDSEQGWSECVESIEEYCGLERLGLIHANDCMFGRGSKRDRHAWIGDGFIGEHGFESMVCRPELAGLPVITEMPGEIPDKDAINNERLRTLAKRCA